MSAPATNKREVANEYEQEDPFRSRQKRETMKVKRFDMAEVGGWHSTHYEGWFGPTDDLRYDVARALQEEHGGCENNACDIGSAYETGYPLAAAHLLLGATETPVLDLVLQLHGASGDARFARGAFKEDFEAWAEYFGAHSWECACGAFVYDPEDREEHCGNCLYGAPGAWRRKTRRTDREPDDVSRCARPGKRGR